MNLATLLKEQEIISIRDFIQQLSKITSHPTHKIYTLVKNGKKVGTYIPEEYEEYVWPDDPMGDDAPKIYDSLFANYDKIAFKSGDPNLSMKIDDILYGQNETADTN